MPIALLDRGALRLHIDQAGFALRKPADWRVAAPHADEITIGDPLGRAAALVRVRQLPAAADLVDWLLRDYPATEPGLHQVRILRVESLGPHLACAAFDYGSEVFQGRAGLAAVRHGRQAMLFVAAAARAQWPQHLPLLARILGSVVFDAPPRFAYPPGIDLGRLLRIGLDPPWRSRPAPAHAHRAPRTPRDGI